MVRIDFAFHCAPSSGTITVLSVVVLHAFPKLRYAKTCHPTGTRQVRKGEPAVAYDSPSAQV